MSELEYQILRYLRRKSAPVLWSDILNDFRSLAAPTETNAILKTMLSSGLLVLPSPIADPQLSTVSLSDAAIAKLLKEEDRRAKQESHQQAKIQEEKEKQHARDEKERNRFLREQSRKDADTKAEHRFQYRITLLNAFLNFLFSFLAGLLVEHFTGFLDLVIHFFS